MSLSSVASTLLKLDLRAAMPKPVERTCRKCDTIKSIEEFSYGQHTCKDCRRKQMLAYYHRNKKKWRKPDGKWKGAGR